MHFKFSRLFVVLLTLSIPAFIAYEFLSYSFSFSWLPASWRENSAIIIIGKYVDPVLFTISWLYIMVSLATLIANSIDLMKKESNFISIHYMFFLAVNALVLFFIFLIPLITPVICPIAFASMIFKGLTSRVDYDDLDENTKKFVRRMSIFTGLVVFSLSLIVIPESLSISLSIFRNFWINYLDDLYYFFKALGVAISLGTVIIIYKKGVAESEGRRIDSASLITPGIIATEIVTVIFILFLNYENIELVNVLYYLGPFFSGVAFLINFKKNVRQKSASYGNKFEILVWIALLIMIILFPNEHFRLIVVIISTIIFFIYFILFMEHPKHEEME